MGNNENTASMSVYARQQLVENADVGYGSTAATCLFLVVALVTVLVVMVGRVNVSASGGGR
jgi:trehalose/maltose transport system permease protein